MFVELIVLQSKLWKRFKLRVTPTLVLLDGPTGRLITTDGRDALSEDLQGKDFPWGPKPVNEILTGELLKGNERFDCKTLLDGNVKGFYFSAHWVICFGFCHVILAFFCYDRSVSDAILVYFR